ncbi:hypothetical protein D3C73_1344300 [compost metagenome]
MVNFRQPRDIAQVLLGWNRSHCDLAYLATHTKIVMGTPFSGRAGNDPAAGPFVYHSHRAIGQQYC